jgi:hypothetical protein
MLKIDKNMLKIIEVEPVVLTEQNNDKKLSD